jgi:hypothetical protein
MERGKQFGQYLHEEPTQGELLLCLLLLGVTSANPSHSRGASRGTTQVNNTRAFPALHGKKMVLISDGFILQLTEGKGALPYISAAGFKD